MSRVKLDCCKECGKSFNKVKRAIVDNPAKKRKIYYNRCINCQRAYYKRSNKKYNVIAKQRRKELKLKLILSLGNQCQLCGYNDLSCVGVFDFHHTDNKKEGIARMITKGINKNIVISKDLKKELKSCVLVCANCHRKIHYKE